MIRKIILFIEHFPRPGFWLTDFAETDFFVVNIIVTLSCLFFGCLKQRVKI